MAHEKTLNKGNVALAAALVTLTFNPVFEAQAFTGTASATAVVATAVTVNGTVPLHFGSITIASAGTIAVDPTGTRGAGTGGVTGINAGGAEVAGSVLVNGASGVPIDLTVSGTGATLSNGTATMTLSAVDVVAAANGNSTTVTLTAAGSSAVPFGATLNAAGGEGAGTYTGTFPVVANYQ